MLGIALWLVLIRPYIYNCMLCPSGIPYRITAYFRFGNCCVFCYDPALLTHYQIH